MRANGYSGVLPLAIFVSLFLLVCYVGSYLILLDASRTFKYVADGPTYCIPKYRINSRLVWQFYWPVLYIDMHVRPNHWDDDGTPPYYYLLESS